MSDDLKIIEYRVREVTRYIVTGYAGFKDQAFSTCHGEISDEDTAYLVAQSLCKAHVDRLGLSPDDERVVFPNRPKCEAGDIEGLQMLVPEQKI